MLSEVAGKNRPCSPDLSTLAGNGAEAGEGEVHLSCPSLRIVVVVHCLTFLITAFSWAQNKPPTQSQPPAQNQPPVQSQPSAPTKPKRATAKTRPLGDYVPCLFDSGENYALRAYQDPSSKPLTPAEAQTAANAAKSSVASVVAAGGASADAAMKFSNAITPSKLQGKSPAELPAAIMAIGAEAGADNATSASAGSAAKDAVAGGTFERPPDVSCSFSILQWQETSDTFGSRVANQYVALEVNVRNLNTQNEFLIHDVQIAVDTGLNPEQFGRFEAARDKLVVRDVAQRGQTEDLRNRIINLLQMMGAIAGGASAAVTQAFSSTAQANDFSTAVAIFQGPVINGLINVFPDHTIEHINHINDLAFSASSTNKTIVPVQGSVPLVTFLSEKPLEQLPFARCGKGKTKANIAAVDDAVCAPDDESGSTSSNNKAPSTSSALTTDSTVTSYYSAPRLHFKKWSPLAVAVLERRVFVVIAGVHIKEAATQPTLSSITCEPDNDTTIALSKVTGPNVTCTVKGQDLDLVSQIVLKNATDTKDQTQIIGVSSVHGDATQATVLFGANDLTGLKGMTYKVYYALKDSTPQPATLTVTVQQVVSLDSMTLTFSAKSGSTNVSKDLTLTNNGSATLNVTAVDITGPNAKDFQETGGCVPPAPTAAAPNPSVQVNAGGACKATVTYKVPASGSSVSNAVLSISYRGPGSPQTVQLTGTASEQ